MSGRWTRRAVKNLKRGDIISPEYNWAARVLKVAPIWGRADAVLLICDPHDVADRYRYPMEMWDEIIGPHQFGLNQRPLFWDGPNDLDAAFKAPRF